MLFRYCCVNEATSGGETENFACYEVLSLVSADALLISVPGFVFRQGGMRAEET